MGLTAKLACSQLKINRGRTIWTLMEIAFSTAMITVLFGFTASGIATFDGLFNKMLVEGFYNIARK